MASQKNVKIKLETEANLQRVQALEDKIKQIKKEKLQLEIDANTSKLQETENRIQSLKIFLDNVNTGNTNIHIDDSEIKKAEQELDSLESEKIELQLAVETGKLDSAKAEIEDLDGTTIDIDVNNITAMEAVEQISSGFDRLKQGAGEVGQVMGDVLESAGRMEQTESFLSMNIGADQAKKKLEEIRAVTDELPGDDVTLQNLLSQAALKDLKMGHDEFKLMGTAAADYMAAMQNFGKTSTETQQDLMNYILAGNTAEIERSPILQAHVDKLKEGTTVQERAKLLQEALTEEGWAGIASQDIYNNKLQQFNDMLERGKMNLGDVFLNGSEGAMDFLINLDNATGGLVGMAAAVGSFASPLTDTLLGVGQLATGLNSLKELGMIKWIKELELATKAQAVASKFAAAMQWLWNFAVIENPIVLIVVALIALTAALVWAYYNVDWFREMVDNAWASLVQIGQVIYSYVAPVIQWLSNLFNNFTSQIGLNTNDWIQAVLGFLLFLPQLPLQVGIALVNALARVLGFKGKFVQSMISAGANAVNGFIKYITQLPGIVLGEFNRVLGLVNDFINTLPDRVWDMGAAIIDALKKSLGIGSPGHMFYMIQGEFDRIDNLTQKTRFDTGSIGADMVSSFNPNLNAGSSGVLSGSAIGGDTIINVYGDVDSDKRVREIVEAVRRELSFNNETAGRTV